MYPVINNNNNNKNINNTKELIMWYIIPSIARTSNNLKTRFDELKN